MHAIIAAGSDGNENDPLLSYTQTKAKALIPIRGRPMVSYVIDALLGSHSIDHVTLVGLPEEEKKRWEHLPVDVVHSNGHLIDNVLAGIEHVCTHSPSVDRILLSSADVPLLTAEIVDAFVAQCTDESIDLYCPLVRRETLEAKFPNAGQTYINLREGAFVNGDLFLIRPQNLPDREALEVLFSSRKAIWKQIRASGPHYLLKLLLRRLSLAEAEEALGHILACRGRGVVVEWPELAMDIDKPHQLDIVRAVLERRYV